MGSGSLLVPGFDPAKMAGQLRLIYDHGGAETLMNRPGEVPVRSYDLDEAIPSLFVLWKRIDAPRDLSPEVWTNQGFANLAWGGLPRTRWRDAEVVVRPGKKGLEAWVTRSLAAENEAAPMLRIKERYLVSPRGLKLEKQVLGKLTTPDQRLNWAAELGHRGELGGMIGQVRKLRQSPPEYMQRAAILMTKFGSGTRLADQATKILELLASESRSPEVAAAAADRILEMAWEQTRDGAKK